MGDYLYVVNIGNIMCYCYVLGEIWVVDLGMEFIDLLDIINYYWIKVLFVSFDGCKFYVGVGLNSNIIENGVVIEYCCVVIFEVDVVSCGSCIYVFGLCNLIGL